MHLQFPTAALLEHTNIEQSSFGLHISKPKSNTRAALYTRVSTKDKGQETANQLAQLRDFCRSQSWDVVAEYEDHDSGSNPDRTQLKAMLNGAMKREFDIVVFWALDRFTREGALQTLQYLNLLSSYGVGFRSYTEPYLDSCGLFKEAVIAILGTIAKQERIRISERVTAGLRRAKENGTRSGNPIGRPRIIFNRDTVVRLRNAGRSWNQIATEIGVSVTSVRRVYLQRQGPGSGCQNLSPEAA